MKARGNTCPLCGPVVYTDHGNMWVYVVSLPCRHADAVVALGAPRHWDFIPAVREEDYLQRGSYSSIPVVFSLQPLGLAAGIKAAGLFGSIVMRRAMVGERYHGVMRYVDLAAHRRSTERPTIEVRLAIAALPASLAEWADHLWMLELPQESYGRIKRHDFSLGARRQDFSPDQELPICGEEGR